MCLVPKLVLLLLSLNEYYCIANHYAEIVPADLIVSKLWYTVHSRDGGLIADIVSKLCTHTPALKASSMSTIIALQYHIFQLLFES